MNAFDMLSPQRVGVAYRYFEAGEAAQLLDPAAARDDSPHRCNGFSRPARISPALLQVWP
jgi:hypothetical protein